MNYEEHTPVYNPLHWGGEAEQVKQQNNPHVQGARAKEMGLTELISFPRERNWVAC